MKNRLLFILPTLSQGGQERVVSRLSQEFKDYEKFLVLFYRDRIDYEFKGEIIKLDLPLPSKSFWRIYLKIFYLFTSIFKIKSIKQKIKPKIVLSFGPEANIINVLSNLFLKEKPKLILSVRIVESEHFKNYPFFLRAYYFWMMRFVYRKGDVIVVNSKDIKEDLIKNFSVEPEKIKIIYNPYDLEKIQELAKEPLEEYSDLFQNHRVIISIGRLTYQKNFSFLIKAFAQLEKLFPNLILVILGEGELLNELKKLASDLDVRDKVYFLGFQKNPFKFLKNSEIFVFPSLYEGFPNVLLEAMACGLPVIITDFPGASKEILSLKENLEWQDGVSLADFGILVENNNLNALTKAIKMMLEDEFLKKNYREKSLIRVKDFEASTIANQWLNLFQFLIQS